MDWLLSECGVLAFAEAVSVVVLWRAYTRNRRQDDERLLRAAELLARLTQDRKE